MIRALNYSLTSEEDMNNCQEIYLEIEFRENNRECQYGKIPQYSNEVI
jgi:hypothetical protein